MFVPDIREPVTFTVPPWNSVTDLHGNPINAELIAFVNGNQFMVMDDLFTAFRAAHPAIQHIFFETLPPGILIAQVRQGALRMGELLLRVQADVLAAGLDQLTELHTAGISETPITYAANDLALLVTAGNPLGLHTLADLGRPGLRVALPNPQTEGVGRLILDVCAKAGGEALVTHLMVEKAHLGEMRLTQIHHRESIAWLMQGVVDAAPLWTTEAQFHVRAGAPVTQVKLPPEQNLQGQYALAALREARHPVAAHAFVRFMQSAAARDVYARFGFAPPPTNA